MLVHLPREVGHGLIPRTKNGPALAGYQTRAQARADVFDYIERFYNPFRKHSKLNYLSPVQFEERQRLKG
jgi:transposase InsO family protein